MADPIITHAIDGAFNMALHFLSLTTGDGITGQFALNRYTRKYIKFSCSLQMKTNPYNIHIDLHYPHSNLVYNNNVLIIIVVNLSNTRFLAVVWLSI